MAEWRAAGRGGRVVLLQRLNGVERIEARRGRREGPGARASGQRERRPAERLPVVRHRAPRLPRHPVPGQSQGSCAGCCGLHCGLPPLWGRPSGGAPRRRLKAERVERAWAMLCRIFGASFGSAFLRYLAHAAS